MGSCRIALILSCGLLAGCLSKNESADSKPAPPLPTKVNLLAMADWGSDAPSQKTVANALANYVATSDQTFSGMLLCGDNFNTALSGTDDPKWQRQFETMYDPAVLNFPFYATLGHQDYVNHNKRIERDYARQNPTSRWKYPAPFYRIDIPDNLPMVTVFMLDSNQQAMTPAEWNAETYWLKSELQRPRTSRWIIVASHHPLFGHAMPGESLQQTWGTLFKQYGVDLYVCGHNRDPEHLEEPGWPMSFVYLGGEEEQGRQLPSGYHSSMPTREAHGFAAISFTQYAIDVKLIGSEGQVLNEFRRSKAGTVESVPVPMATPSDTSETSPTTRATTKPTTQPMMSPATHPMTHYSSTTRPTH